MRYFLQEVSITRKEKSKGENKGQTSRLSQQQEDWNKLWRISEPNAENHFLWKACHCALPTEANFLKKRIVEDDPMCPICSQDHETTQHAIWECESVRDVWGQCSRPLQQYSIINQSFKDNDVINLLKTLDSEVLEEFAVVACMIYGREEMKWFFNKFLYLPTSSKQSNDLLFRVPILQASIVNVRYLQEEYSRSNGMFLSTNITPKQGLELL